MLFTQPEFIILAVVVSGRVFFTKSNGPRKVILVIASCYFYACWDWRFLSLIMVTTAVDYAVGRGLDREERPAARRLLLGASLAVNLGILGVFKYCNFFISSMECLLAPLGLNPGTLDIILPVGLSFYTFKTLTYTIDVYRRCIPSCRSIVDYALFVAFFPTLVAGPILRASHFLPQLTGLRTITGESLLAGSRLVIIGMFKKVFIADRLGLFVDPFFANAAAFDTPTAWLAVISYTLQIYFDFSGYTDMAIGISRILGYDVPVNFNFPYLSKSIGEFWQRWHISLSTWIRDYLYIPLAGTGRERQGPMPTCSCP